MGGPRHCQPRVPAAGTFHGHSTVTTLANQHDTSLSRAADFDQMSPGFHERPFAVQELTQDSTLPRGLSALDASPSVPEHRPTV